MGRRGIFTGGGTIHIIYGDHSYHRHVYACICVCMRVYVYVYMYEKYIQLLYIHVYYVIHLVHIQHDIHCISLGAYTTRYTSVYVTYIYTSPPTTPPYKGALRPSGVVLGVEKRGGKGDESQMRRSRFESTLGRNFSHFRNAIFKIIVE